MSGGIQILDRQPKNQRPFADGRKVGAGEAKVLFLCDKTGNPAMGPAPCGTEGQTASVSLPIGTDQPFVPADLQQALRLHIQKSDSFNRTVAFPDGGQGDVLVASDLISHRMDSLL